MGCRTGPAQPTDHILQAYEISLLLYLPTDPYVKRRLCERPKDAPNGIKKAQKKRMNLPGQHSNTHAPFRQSLPPSRLPRAHQLRPAGCCRAMLQNVSRPRRCSGEQVPSRRKQDNGQHCLTHVRQLSRSASSPRRYPHPASVQDQWPVEAPDRAPSDCRRPGTQARRDGVQRRGMWYGIVAREEGLRSTGQGRGAQGKPLRCSTAAGVEGSIPRPGQSVYPRTPSPRDDSQQDFLPSA